MMLQNYGLFFIHTVAIWWQFISKSRIRLVFYKIMRIFAP